MTKLDLLKSEKETIERLTLIPETSKRLLSAWYQRGIEEIEVYGRDNPEVAEAGGD